MKIPIHIEVSDTNPEECGDNCTFKEYVVMNVKACNNKILVDSKQYYCYNLLIN